MSLPWRGKVHCVTALAVLAMLRRVPVKDPVPDVTARIEKARKATWRGSRGGR